MPFGCRACLPWAGAMVCVALSCAFAGELAAAAVPSYASRSCAPRPHFRGIPGQDARAIDPAAPNPLAGLPLYVDPREPANRSYRAYRRRGQRGKAALMARVAGQPRFRWFGRWTGPRTTTNVRRHLDCAARSASAPLMVVMRHQGKRCHRSYQAGGRAEDARSRAWYRKFAAGVGAARVVIGFEPDSLGTLECLAPRRRRARLELLRYGVDVLSALPNATIYLEAGAADWEVAPRTAHQLRYIGISKVRGFMLNVTHHAWTQHNIRHGLEISRRVGGKPFIINTSFNGRGPVHFRRWINRRAHKWRTINVWCHPLRRGLGIAPTTATHHPLVDGYMWINRPGYSAGSCNGGPLPVGSWWPERALMYARWQTDWIRPPRGTRAGHFRHLSARQLGCPASVC